MNKIIEKLKTAPMPMKIVVGISIVFIIIVLAWLGFKFGVWLKGVS